MNEALKKCADAVANIARRMDAMLMRRNDAKTNIDRAISGLHAALDADRYVAQLSDALGDDKKFPVLFDGIKKLPLETLKEICRQFTGAKERTKSDALFKIWKRHQTLMTLEARATATGGRTAA